MITLDQINLLDAKVQSAVELISGLRTENKGLNSKLDEYRKRIDELEVLITNFKNDQGEIENGILNALSQLDQIEEDISIKKESADTSSAADDSPGNSQPDTTVPESEINTKLEDSTEENVTDDNEKLQEKQETDAELDIF